MSSPRLNILQKKALMDMSYCGQCLVCFSVAVNGTLLCSMTDITMLVYLLYFCVNKHEGLVLQC